MAQDQNRTGPGGCVSNTEIAGFYDEFSRRLLDGYVSGNPRIDHAVRFTTAHLPTTAHSLLEVGCGVGETTSRIAAFQPELRVVGVDISPQNVATAERLFADSARATFRVSDLTQPVEGGPFDVVTLLDVYEHIPAAARESFHQNLRQSMSDSSRLIVTCPSFLHQDYLRDHQPEGLQIVDETIGPAELLALARDLDGQLSHLQYESVWRTNDYVYATIDRQMEYQWKAKPSGLQRWSKKVNGLLDRTPIGGRARRSRHVRRRFAA